MIQIDEYFKRGKSQKFKIWKNLRGYRKSRENLIGRIMTEICTVYDTSNHVYFNDLFYDIKGFIKDIGILRKIKMKEKTRALFEKIIFRLIRIIRDGKLNEEEIDALITTVKKAQLGDTEKIYLENIKILK